MVAFRNVRKSLFHQVKDGRQIPLSFPSYCYVYNHQYLVLIVLILLEWRFLVSVSYLVFIFPVHIIQSVRKSPAA